MGMGRQPRRTSPSAAQASATACSATRRAVSSVASRKAVTTPQPAEPSGARPASRATRAKKACGIGSRIPAPSPETPSAATADRWRTQASPTRAESRRARLARPSASATRPMPQASRSNRAGGRKLLMPPLVIGTGGPEPRKKRRPWTFGGWDDAAVVLPSYRADPGAQAPAARRSPNDSARHSMSAAGSVTAAGSRLTPRWRRSSQVSKREVHRAADPRTHGPAGHHRGSGHEPARPQAGDDRGGEVDRAGLGPQRRHQHRGGQEADQPGQPLGQAEARLGGQGGQGTG